MRQGNFGDVKAVGDDVSEMRLDISAGYRVYFTKYQDEIVFLLNGGDKSSQVKDIEKAKVLLMQLHGLTEDTAFQLLRKNAMSHRMTIGEMARRLLDAQELLNNQLRMNK